MNVTTQFAVLFLVCMAGTMISNLFPFPLPASVTSMIVMICLLALSAIRLESLRVSADFLLDNMALFFIPPGVGILSHLESLRGDMLVLLGICFATTILTLVVTAYTVLFVMRLTKRTRRVG